MTSNRGIDYSKWDKMDFSDDDDNSTNSEQNTFPRVTRLDEPSSVTVKDGSVNIQKGEVMAEKKKTNINTSIKKKVDGGTTCIESIKTTCTGDDRRRSILTHNGGSYIDQLTNTETFWSQDRHEVIFSISFDFLKILSRDIRVEVKGGLSYSDRFAAVGGSKVTDQDSDGKGEIHVKTTTGINIFRGHLAYSIYLPEGEEEVDWEIDATDPNKKLIKITLLKALPMQGLTIWWSKPMVKYPEIDVVRDIQGRGNDNNRDDSTSKQEQMKAVWDEAHRLFREKVKKREKHTIDI